MKKYILVAMALVFSGGAAHAKQPTDRPQSPYCREYTQKFIINGHAETGYGTACMQPDGAWEITQPAQVGQETANSEVIVSDALVYVTAPPPYYYAPYPPYYSPVRTSIGISFCSSYRHGHHGGHYGHYGRGHHGRW